MKKVIITGPTGAIGIALIKKLIQEKIYIYAICRTNSKRINRIPKSEYITVIENDLCNLLNVKDKIFDKCDVFYHFGWDGTFGDSRNNMYLQNNNIKYTLDAVKLAEYLGCKVFIGAGSQAEYGCVDGVLKPSTPTFPETGYGIAKLCAGQMSRILCNQKFIKHIWVRILSVYGPYDGDNTMVMSTIIKLCKGKSMSFTKGEQQWDYLYSDDAAEAFYLIGLYGKSDSIYCLGSGQTKRLLEYINIIKEQINPNVKLGIGDIPYSKNQVMNLCADISKLSKDTGFKPNIKFEDGIKMTRDWYLSTNKF